MRYPARVCVVTLFAAISFAANPAGLAAQTVAGQALEAHDAGSGQSQASQRQASPAQASQGEVATSVRGLLEQTVEDFKQLPSLQNLAILTVGGIGATFGHAMDRDVTNAMSNSAGLGGVLHPGETVGGARSQFAAAVATYTIGRISGSNKVAAIGSDLIRAQIVTQTLTAGIKLSVGRTRPDGTMYSFPSGHSSVTFATATVLQRNLGWKVGLPAYGLATYVAASRVQVKRHFLSDVAFGAALGIVAGRSVTVGHGDARFAVAPAAAPGGAAVAFTWLGKN
jgi:membrane-associated phospholipid phosphatase